jgi:DNA-binding transcriptional MerR regulator
MTGVSAATLRAWERRYGFPVPERTTSSYRLYSERDVAMLQRLRELCDDGMAPAQAAKLVLAEEESEPAGTREDPSEHDPFEIAADRILDAVHRFAPEALEDAVRGAMFLGTPEVVYDKVLAPVMRTVGDKWHAGEFSIAQEHLTSHILSTALQDMLRMVQPRTHERRALLGCTADEEHVLPLYGIAFRLASWGINTVILGGRTPPSAIRDAREAIGPHIIGLSTTMAPPGHRARELFEGYRMACDDVPWLVGGQAAAAMRDVIEKAGGEVFDEDDLRRVRSRVEAMIASHRRK